MLLERRPEPDAPVKIAAHTALTLQIHDNLPMRIGQPVRAALLYPVYSGASLVIPEKTTVTGAVIGLRPDHSKRVRARFNLDFTPFRIPVVKFDQVTLPNGTSLPIAIDSAADGVSIVHLTLSPTRKREGFIRQQFSAATQLVLDQFNFFAAPGKGDRIVQLFFHQLPWHPQRIERGTAWTVNL